MFPLVAAVRRPAGRATLFALLSLVAGSTWVPSSASGQFTAKQLIAPAVEEYGPEYKNVESAVAAFRRGDFPGARKSLLAARETHPELAPADVMLAVLYLAAGMRENAEKAIDQAVVQQPGDPEAYVLAADLALRAGQRTFAGLGYERAAALLDGFDDNPRRKRYLQARIHAGLASLSEARGQFEEALENLEAWRALDEKNPVPWGSLGRVRFQLEDYDAARAAFEKLNELAEDSPPADIAMGRLYSDAGMVEEARKNMERAVAVGENDVRTRLTVAEWALSTGLLELAQENIQAALQLEQDSLGGKILAARFARQQGDLGKAEVLLNAAVLKSPNNFSATNELARVLAVSNDQAKRDTALQYARRNFQQQRNRNSPAGVEAVMTYAWTLMQNNRAAESEAALNALPSGSSLSHENAYYAAKIYAERGKRDVALSALRAALTGEVAFPGKKEAVALREELVGTDG